LAASQADLHFRRGLFCCGLTGLFVYLHFAFVLTPLQQFDLPIYIKTTILASKSLTHYEFSFHSFSTADLELIAQLKSKLQYAELRIRVLEERLMRIEKYGAGGERLSQAQMQYSSLGLSSVK